MNMRTFVYLFLTALLPVAAPAQSTTPILLGACSSEDLKKDPYAEWFTPYYTAYEPNETVIGQLKNLNLKDYSVTIFFGVWCGDSQREVPRFLKLMDIIGFPKEAINLIALGSDIPLYRQSPGHEEEGRHIYRVPTFIISKHDREINRIVEFPAASLERDLLNIVSNNNYVPNYPLFILLAQWIEDGSLIDDNVSHKGLANQIRSLSHSPNELYSFGYLLSHRDSTNLKPVATIFQLNCNLYPDVWWTYSRLAGILEKSGQDEQAIEILQEGMEAIKNPTDVKYLQELLDEILSKEE
jgi:hypothetical protein